MKHCLSVYEQNITVNSVRVDDLTAEIDTKDLCMLT